MNFPAASFAERNSITFSKMIAHVHTDAIARTIITVLTTKSACKNNPNIDRSVAVGAKDAAGIEKLPFKIAVLRGSLIHIH